MPRHVFTTEERQKGFQNALDSIVRRYPDAQDKHGRHISCGFLKWVNKRAAKKAQETAETSAKGAENPDADPFAGE